MLTVHTANVRSSPMETLEQSQTMKVRSFLPIIILSLLLHLVINGQRISHREFWLDEATTYILATQPLPDAVRLAVEAHAQPPLYYVMVHFFAEFSDSELSLRGFSWLVFAFLIASSPFLLRTLNPLAVLVFGVVVATSDVTFFAAREFRPYALAALTTFVATMLFLDLLKRPGWKYSVLYGLSAVLMLYSLAFCVWPFTCHWLYCFALVIIAVKNWGWKKGISTYVAPIAVLILVTIAYLPYLITVTHLQGHVGKPSLSGSLLEMLSPLNYASGIGWLTRLSLPWNPLAIPSHSVANWVPDVWDVAFSWNSLVVLSSAVLSCLSGYALWILAQRRDPVIILWLLLIVGQVAFCRGFLHGRSFWASRYLTPAFPAVAYLVALSVHCLTRDRWQRLIKVSGVGILVVILALSPRFFDGLSEPLPIGLWRGLHSDIDNFNGGKAIFFDVGWEGAPFEYEIRHDRDIKVYTNRAKTGWGATGQRLSCQYVEASARRISEKAQHIFYHVDLKKRGSNVYQDCFQPLVLSTGFRWNYFKPVPGHISPNATVFGFSAERSFQ